MPVSSPPAYTVATLARALGLEFDGPGERSLQDVASLQSAQPADLCFLQSHRYLAALRNSACGAVIVTPGFDEPVADKALLFAANPHLSFVHAIALLRPDAVARTQPGIHPSAQIAASATLGDGVHIGANAVIGEQVRVASGVSIGAGCVIETGCDIGEESVLKSNVTLCHGAKIGRRVILHPGVVIGADGFGLVYDAGQWTKIPHLGSVSISDEVEIGANTTVDRGALDDTVIERGAKLDNQIQVAHNVHIGENTAIAGCVGIAGSAFIGKNCKISGAASVLGHLTIADNVTITAGSMVTKSITDSGTYSSGTPLLENREWKRVSARYKSLDRLAKGLSGPNKKNT